jgi:hypothetical protein
MANLVRGRLESAAFREPGRDGWLAGGGGQQQA